MKRLLLDLNVVLDVLLVRSPHEAAATAVWAAIERGRGTGLVPAHGFTTVYYIAGRVRSAVFARRALADLLTVFEAAPVDGRVLRRALDLSWPDFEDAVCAAAAEASGCDAIVSRDPAGFPNSPVPVIDPGTALAWLAAR